MTTPVNEPDTSATRSFSDSALTLSDFFASMISLHKPINNDIANAANSDILLSKLQRHNIWVNIHTINNDIV